MHPFPPVSPDGLQCYVWYGWGILYSFRKLNLEEKLKHQMLFCKKQMKNYGCVILKECILKNNLSKPCFASLTEVMYL